MKILIIILILIFIYNKYNKKEEFTSQYDIVNNNVKSIFSSDKLNDIKPSNYKFKIKPSTNNTSYNDFYDRIKTINIDNNNYTFIGIAYNEYYDMKYVIYEFLINNNKNIEKKSDDVFNNYFDDKDNLGNKFNQYRYLLGRIVKEDNNEVVEIIHDVGIRRKIKNNDYITVSQGPIQLGLLTVKYI